jgi:hypothetical protein
VVHFNGAIHRIGEERTGMLILLLVWLLLAATSFFWGSGFVALTVAHAEPRFKMNVFFGRLWCGFMIQAGVGLILGLVGPVSAARVLMLSLGVCLMSALSPRVRADVASLWRSVKATSSCNVIVTSALALIAAWLFSQAPADIDTLLYHHQLTKWLAKFGAVKGLALIHNRFGFISSTFALAAPLESVLPGRSGTAVNGFVLCVAVIQASVMLVGNRSRLSSGRMFFPLGVVGTIALQSALREPTGASPDFAASVLAIAAIWALLERDPEGEALAAAFVISCGLPLLKLSTAPAGAVIALVSLGGFWRRQQTRLFVPLGVSALLAMAFAATSLRVTGALLFPVAETSVNVPWGLGAEETQRVALDVRDWARWNGPPPEGMTPYAWLGPWWRSGKGILFCTLSAGNLLLLVWCALKRPQGGSKGGQPWLPAAAGLATSLYMFGMAPNPRFGVGLLSLGWFEIAAVVAGWLVEREHSGQSARILSRPSLAVASMAVLLVVVSFWPLDTWRRALNTSSRRPFFAASTGRFNWLMPAAVPSIGFVRREGGGAASAFPIELKQDHLDGFAYSYPTKADTCGPAPLPCAPGRLSGAKLADPHRSLSGGFLRDP